VDHSGYLKNYFKFWRIPCLAGYRDVLIISDCACRNVSVYVFRWLECLRCVLAPERLSFSIACIRRNLVTLHGKTPIHAGTARPPTDTVIHLMAVIALDGGGDIISTWQLLRPRYSRYVFFQRIERCSSEWAVPLRESEEDFRTNRFSSWIRTVLPFASRQRTVVVWRCVSLAQLCLISVQPGA